MRILIVEDEESLAELVANRLKKEKYIVDISSDGEEGLYNALMDVYDLILLDIMLPGVDGIEILKEIKKNNIKAKVIMLTAKSELEDKLLGFSEGANDYISKPFGTSELLARIRTALRHSLMANSSTPANDIFKTKELTIDFDKRQITVDGKDVHLTQIEFKIVSLLAKSAGRVLTYDFIITELWGPYAVKDNQILRVNMANIRRKLEKNPASPEYIFTEVGVGYRMTDEP